MKKLISLCALFALSTVMALAADVTGTWKGEAGGRGGPPTFNLKQSGETLTGTSVGRGGETEISNGKVDGDKVYFEVTRDMGDKGKYTAKYSGTVLLSIVVDERGIPRDIRVVRPLGLGLDEKAIEAVRHWRFRPGMKNGRPVNVRATVEVSFRLL